MSALLVQKTYFSTPGSFFVPASAGTTPSGDQWYGIYMKGEKIGTSHTQIVKEKREIRLRDETFLKLTLLGIPRELRITTRGRLSPAFALRSFDFHLTSFLVDFHARGEVLGRELFVKVTAGGEPENIALDFKTPPLLWTALTPALLARGVEVGKSYRLPVFDPSTLSQREVTVRVAGVENLRLGGKSVSARLLESEFAGIRTRSWIDSSGNVLKEESPMGLTLVRETREQALRPQGGKSVADLLIMTAAPSSRTIDRPREVRSLQVRLQGISTRGLALSGGRQELRGRILTVVREEIPAGPVSFPIRGRELSPFLKAEPFIQSDSSAIRDEAEKIAGGETDAVRATRLLMDWVYRNLEKVPTVSIPSALDVLRTRRGDCNEHAVLFTALSRSLGIPSRIVAGIIYYRGKFYYHAWSENFLGRWVAVDPLLDQMPADATHIRLVEGNMAQQVPLLKVIGRLRVRVVNYE